MGRRMHAAKKNAQRGKLVIACLACAVVLAGLLVTAGVLTYREANMVYPLVRAEAGLVHLDPDVFLRDSSRRATFAKGVTQEQLTTPGVYDVIIRCDGRTYPAALEVVDTVAPMAAANAVTSTGMLPAPEQFVSQLVDATQVTITYKSVPNVTQAGVQTVTLLLTDAAGNTSELQAELTVVLDDGQDDKIDDGQGDKIYDWPDVNEEDS